MRFPLIGIKERLYHLKGTKYIHNIDVTVKEKEQVEKLLKEKETEG